MNPFSLREFFHNQIFQYSSEEISENQLSIPVSHQFNEYFKLVNFRRRQLFEEHFQNGLKKLEFDLKQIFDEISKFENSIWNLEKLISETESKIQKENETFQRLKFRFETITKEFEKKKTEKNDEIKKMDEKWIFEASEIETKLFETKIKKENLKSKKFLLIENLKQLKIDENNLRHRFFIFNGIFNFEKNSLKNYENFTKILELEMEKTKTMEEKIENLKKFLKIGKIQEKNLEKNIKTKKYEKITKIETILLVEKQNLQIEFENLNFLLIKINKKL